MSDQGHGCARRACRDHAGKANLKPVIKSSIALAVLTCLTAQFANACDYPPGPPDAEYWETDKGDGPRRAFYIAATDRYPHGALGDAIEAGGLVVLTAEDIATGGCGTSLLLPEDAVFEDTGPRIADLDNDGSNEVIVVESDARQGAQLAAYGLRDGNLTKIAATSYIGRSNRWLAPVGIADFDADGSDEVAYIETPHLGKILRIVALQDGRFEEVLAVKGLTNHRFGERYISGGVKICWEDAAPELVTANADWSRIYISRIEDGRLLTFDVGPLRGLEDFEDALACR